MYSNIKQLMRNGERLKEQDVGPGVYGEVSMVWWKGQPRLMVGVGDGMGTQGNLLPTLWFVECVMFQANEQHWSGWQRGANGKPVRQEWKITYHCERPHP